MEDRQEGLQRCVEGEPKTFSLGSQRLSVLASQKKMAEESSAADCVKTGPCPCESPCPWGQQALGDVLQAGWPGPALRLLSFPPRDKPD